MKSRFAKVAVLLMSAAAALFAAEVSLRVFFHAAPQLDLDIYRKENGLLLLQPNLERRHVTRLWDVSVRTNSEGWRDRERETSAGAVLGLGDSFAFGWGVELEEGFYSLVEKRVSAPLINVGVPATATIDHEKLLQQLMPRYRPRFVVLAFFVGNDFTETGLGGAERLDVVDGLMQLKPLDGEVAPTSWRQLASKSHFLQLLRAVQFRLEANSGPSDPPRNWDSWMREFAQVHLRQPSPRAEEAMQLTLESLDRIADQCNRGGVGLAVLVLPRSFQVEEGEQEEMRLALGLAPEDLDMDKPQRLLREWASSKDVMLVDLLEDFRARHLAGAKLYYSPDAHFTPEGHRAAAEVLAVALADQANL